MDKNEYDFVHNEKVNDQGFKRDLFSSPTKFWSLKRESDDKFNGINNCDSFLNEDDRAEYFSIHQVYVKMNELSSEEI